MGIELKDISRKELLENPDNFITNDNISQNIKNDILKFKNCCFKS